MVFQLVYFPVKPIFILFSVYNFFADPFYLQMIDGYTLVDIVSAQLIYLFMEIDPNNRKKKKS